MKNKIGILALICLAVFVIAQSSDLSSLESEFNNLTEELNAQGFDWLISFIILPLYLNINFVYKWRLKSMK